MSKQGEFIKLARRKLGLTQKQLANKLTVSDKVVSKWEVGDSFPDYTLLPKLAEILHVEIQEILNGEYNEKVKTVETKSTVYIESKPANFKEKIIYGLKYINKNKNIFFASFLGFSLILMFCNYFSWQIPQLGFSINFFKFLFAPFQSDINKYLYGDYVSIYSFTTNTNIIVYILSFLIWVYLLFIIYCVYKLVVSAIKKKQIDTKTVFIYTLVYSIFTVALFILSFVLKSQFINMFNSSGLNFNNYEAQGLGIKTCSVFPLLWSFVLVTLSSLFNYVKVFSKEIEHSIYTKELKVQLSNDEKRKETKVKTELTTQQKNKRKKIAIIVLIVACILIACVCGIVVYVKAKPSAQKTINAYLNNLNTSSYDKNLDLIYGADGNDKQLYESLVYGYKLYNNFTLSQLNIEYQENNFYVCNATITGNYITSGTSTLTTYKIDIPIYNYEGKYLFLEPLDFVSGSSLNIDKENKCVIKNNELILYFGNDYDNFIIPEGITSVKDSFFINVKNNSKILSNVPGQNFVQWGETIELSSPTKAGYEFVGWIGTDLVVPQKSVYFSKDLGKNRYYIAVWNLIYYSISYSGSAVDGGNDYFISRMNNYFENNDYPTSYTVEDEIILKTPQIEGLVFLGWEGTDIGFFISKNVKIPKGSTGNRVYQADWDYIWYSIYYMYSGGTIDGAVITNYNMFTETFTLKTPTRDGYRFTGWTGSNGSIPQETVTIPQGSMGDKDYTANWENATYYITYENVDDALFNPDAFHIYSHTFTLKTPTRDGYRFTGWTGSNGSIPQETVTIPKGSTGDRVYTANWEAIIYQIGYNLDGGYVDGTNPSEYSIESETIILINPKKEGYTFLGWIYVGDYVDEMEPQKTIEILSGSIGDKYYNACWSMATYTIVYGSNGGVNLNTEFEFTINDLGLELKTAYKNDSFFEGWYTDDAYQNRIDIITECKDHILYAHFIQASSNLNYTLETNLHSYNTIVGETDTYYVVSIENVTDPMLFIPNYHNNLPVAVVTGSFEQHNNSTTSAFISQGLCKTNEYAFKNFVSLHAVYIPESLIEFSGNAFAGCQNLNKVYYEGTIEDWCRIEFGSASSNPMDYATYFYLRNETGDWRILEDLDIPNTITTIHKFSFLGFDCNSVIIPSSVKTIRESAFYDFGCLGVYYCGTIEDWCKIDFEDANANPLSWARSCLCLMDEQNNTWYPLTDVVFSNNITEIKKNTFCNSYGLRSVIIPSGVTIIGDGAFVGCGNLTSITIPSSVTTIGKHAFSIIDREDFTDEILKVYYEGTIEDWCKINFEDNYSNPLIHYSALYLKVNDEWCEITDIVIPNTIGAIRQYTFSDCKFLTSVFIPNSVCSIGQGAFSGCYNLKEVVFQEYSCLTGIGDGAFSNCSSLTSIDIPMGTVSIGWGSFNKCVSLTQIILPNTIKTIWPVSFFECDKLSIVFFTGDSYDWSLVSNNSEELEAATIYFYSKEEPTEIGNYWRYVDDVPTIW